MPLSKKGQKIKRAMQAQYGKRKGAAVFFASANKVGESNGNPNDRRKQWHAFHWGFLRR